MAIEIRVVRDGNKLVAADAISLEEMEKIARGEVVVAKLTRPRNIGHHRKFFALLSVVYDAQDRYPTMEHLLDAIKFGVGHFDEYPMHKNVRRIVPRSISFSSMKQAAFEKFYSAVIKMVVEEILPGVNSADLDQRVLEIIGDDYGR